MVFCVEHTKAHCHSRRLTWLVDSTKSLINFFYYLQTRYQNKVAVDKNVYKNLKLFIENKNPEDELFDRLNVNATKYFAETSISCIIIEFRSRLIIQDNIAQLVSHGNYERPFS
jgi:hypothetical protein